MTKSLAPIPPAPVISPAWERIKALHEKATGASKAFFMTAIECGRLLAGQKAILCHKNGGDRGGNQHGKWEQGGSVPRGTVPFDELLDTANIPRRTAYRYLEWADRWNAICELAKGRDATVAGNLVKWTPALGKLARQAVELMESEGVNPARLWAGVKGEGDRLEGGSERGAVDVHMQMELGFGSLERWLGAEKHWDSLPHTARSAVIDKARSSARVLVPDVARAMFEELNERFGKRGGGR